MRDIRIGVGKRIKEIRKKKQLSQENLALIAGIDRTYINSVENGRRNISIINLDKIINAFNITYVDFFDSDYFIWEGDQND